MSFKTNEGEDHDPPTTTLSHVGKTLFQSAMSMTENGSMLMEHVEHQPFENGYDGFLKSSNSELLLKKVRPEPVLPPSTTDVLSVSTDNAAPVSSTSTSASSSSTAPAPASATTPSSSTTTPDKISQIILQVVDKLPQNGEKNEELLNPYKGQTFQLPYSTRRRYLVGRSTGKKYTDKGLSLSEDGEVSTCHGEFRTQKGKICFVDKDSTNGSYLNGNRLTPHEGNPLQPGDVLSLGATKMKVSFA